MGKKKEENDIRLKPVQFNFTEEARSKLDQLQIELNLISKSEVVRLSLAILSWLVEELQKGNTILVEREEGKATELAFPFLSVRQK